jgi:hypothetical protein
MGRSAATHFDAHPVADALLHLHANADFGRADRDVDLDLFASLANAHAERNPAIREPHAYGDLRGPDRYSNSTFERECRVCLAVRRGE